MIFVLRMPASRGRGTRRKTLAVRLFDLVVMALIALAVGLIVTYVIRYEMQVEPMRRPTGAEAAAGQIMARQRWARVEPRLVARLRQVNPPELGRVWVRRDGRVCGLVNGWGSFGGLTGMTRFYAQGDEPVFKQDGGADFEQQWWQCKRDRYAIIREGSEETGFCPTRLGRKRCVEVRYGG